MLYKMRTACNRHAEEKVLGEQNIDETKFVYWMATHFSNRVRTIKKDMPAAPREEIRFRICDR
jgi:hypothetical protein